MAKKDGELHGKNAAQQGRYLQLSVSGAAFVYRNGHFTDRLVGLLQLF